MIIQYTKYISCHWIVHLHMVKMITIMYAFSAIKKREKKHIATYLKIIQWGLILTWEILVFKCLPTVSFTSLPSPPTPSQEATLVDPGSPTSGQRCRNVAGLGKRHLTPFQSVAAYCDVLGLLEFCFYTEERSFPLLSTWHYHSSTQLHWLRTWGSSLVLLFL